VQQPRLVAVRFEEGDGGVADGRRIEHRMADVVDLVESQR
jgi:hypothetical protein